MIKTIIFDFFGVFRTDSYIAWLKENNFERTGVFAEASELSDKGLIDGDEFYQRISEAAGKIVTEQDLTSRGVKHSDMIQLARALHRSYKTALLSNAPNEFIREILDDYQIYDIFDQLFISGETGLIKPNPESFLHALNQLVITPAETLFIDDNPTNVAAAAKLGINAIVYTSVDQLRNDLKTYDILVQ